MKKIGRTSDGYEFIESMFIIKERGIMMKKNPYHRPAVTKIGTLEQMTLGLGSKGQKDSGDGKVKIS